MKTYSIVTPTGSTIKIDADFLEWHDNRFYLTVGKSLSENDHNCIVASFGESYSYYIDSSDQSLSFLLNVVLEMERQDNKFGANRNLPSVNKERFHGLVSEKDAKTLCENAMANGSETWADIAVEEMAEVVYSTDDKNRKQELIQLIAVLCQWVKNIERNEK